MTFVLMKDLPHGNESGQMKVDTIPHIIDNVSGDYNIQINLRIVNTCDNLSTIRSMDPFLSVNKNIIS